MERLFFELVEELSAVETDAGSAFLRSIAERYGLSHVSYLGINIPRVQDQAYILTTYSEDWVHRYVSQNYVSIDPVIQFGLRGIIPLDWSTVRNHSLAAAKFFNESKDFGLGRQGLSIPIRGVHGETAMFSLNVEMTDQEWQSVKLSLIRDFQIVAGHFHTRLLENLGVQLELIELSAKEKECLRWVAAGKTAYEISIILGWSDRLVRFYIESARAKLGTVNAPQAVARAIRLNLL